MSEISESQGLRWARGLVVGLLVLTWGCETPSGPTDPGDPAPPNPVVAAIDVNPSSADLLLAPPGNSILLTVHPRDEAGRMMEGAGPATFASTDPAVATVDPSGRVTAAGVGTTEITASITSGGVTTRGTARIAVVDLKLDGRIAFVSDRGGAPKIHVMNADGSGVVRLTDGAHVDSRPAWSPDGGRIAFARAGDASACGIYAMNADGSGLARLTSACGDNHPAWSPDGTRIAFSRWTPETLGQGIHVMSADGSGIIRLTAGLNDEYPAWSPDGGSIAFNQTSDFGGDWFTQVHVMLADGTGGWKLTAGSPGTGYAEGGPAWSPDGSRIAFWSFGYGIATVTGAGDSPFSVYKGGRIGPFDGAVHFYANPAWSSDGQKIVFARGDLGQRKLYVVGAPGRGPLLPLTSDSTPGEDYEPAWIGVGH